MKTDGTPHQGREHPLRRRRRLREKGTGREGNGCSFLRKGEQVMGAVFFKTADGYTVNMDWMQPTKPGEFNIDLAVVDPEGRKLPLRPGEWIGEGKVVAAIPSLCDALREFGEFQIRGVKPKEATASDKAEGQQDGQTPLWRLRWHPSLRWPR